MISVVTPAYRNRAELARAIASLNAQTYGDWQHVVVADGPDPELRHMMRSLGYRGHGQRVFCELGRNWHGLMGGDHGGQPPGSPGARGGRGSRAAEAALVGTHLAAGDLVGYLDADCLYAPRHLEVHASAHAAGADFTWTQMRRHLDGCPWDTVGDGILAHGRIDGNAVVHGAALLRDANWRWGGDADWDVIARWAKAAGRAEFIAEVTVMWHHAAADI